MDKKDLIAINAGISDEAKKVTPGELRQLAQYLQEKFSKDPQWQQNGYYAFVDKDELPEDDDPKTSSPPLVQGIFDQLATHRHSEGIPLAVKQKPGTKQYAITWSDESKRIPHKMTIDITSKRGSNNNITNIEVAGDKFETSDPTFSKLPKELHQRFAVIVDYERNGEKGTVVAIPNPAKNAKPLEWMFCVCTRNSSGKLVVKTLDSKPSVFTTDDFNGDVIQVILTGKSAEAFE